MRFEIKNLEDAPMRCFARTQIVRFIFQKGVTSHFDMANEFALDCLEDIQKNADQFSEQQIGYWKSNLIVLLRVNSPEVAAKAEAKYFSGEKTDWSDMLEIDASHDLGGVTNRIIDRIRRGDLPNDIVFIFTQLRERDPALSLRLLDALLHYLESTPDRTRFASTLPFIEGYFEEDAIPSEIRLRFLRFSIKLAESQLFQRDASELFDVSFNLLSNSLPKIKESIPTLYDQALGIYLAMNSKFLSGKKEYDEAFVRVNESKDKLGQAVLEAGSATDKNLKQALWQYAAQLAVEQKKFQLAVDCTIKSTPDAKSFIGARDYYFIYSIVPAALKVKDFESADYAIKHVELEMDRALGTLKVASAYLDVGDKPQAFERLVDVVKIIEKSEPSAKGVRIILSALPIAMRIEKSKAFELASLGIKIANRLPTPNADEQLGTESRKKYVDSVLVPAAFDVMGAFTILAKSDVGFAAATVQEIQLRSLRLAAEIVVETDRIYPMPKELPKLALKPTAN